MTHIDNARPQCIWGICWDANGDICQVLDDQGHAVPLLLEQPEPEEEAATEADPPGREEEEEDSSMGLQSRLLHMLLEVLDENPLQLDAQELMEQKLMLIAGGINDPLTDDLPSTTFDHNWNVMRPLCNRSSIMAKRVCFANNLQMFEPLPNRMGHMGSYRHVQHSMEYVPLRSMILLEFGQQQLPLLFGDVLYVVRHELIEVVVQSRIVGDKEPHSGRNIFGEATRISLCIRDKEIGLSHSILKQLTSVPDTEIVFFVNPNYIYVLDDRTLLECAELGRHLVPMKNIDYTPS